ncbi:MAG: Riboflavin biosynthesis protein RibF [Chlamydiae bacterium]|nr:Riboflavin biosynthesis protein RibF [Chlamydiota bacterium]
MHLLHSLQKVDALARPIALTIGTFDGVHKGHQYLLSLLRSQVGEEGTVALLSFSNHPSEILPHRDPVLALTSPTIKTRLLEQYGVDLLYLLPFTLQLASLSYKDFLSQLHNACPFDHLFLGQDGRIGHKREGTPEKITKLGEELGFTAHYIKKLDSQNEPISSGKIRTLIQSGNLLEASKLLGHSYQIAGTLQEDQTLLLENTPCLPPDGTYPVILHQKGQPEHGHVRIQEGIIHIEETSFSSQTKLLLEFS